MKKSLLFVLTALTFSFGAIASHPKLPLPQEQKQTATFKSADVKLTPNALGSTISDYESIADWKSIGQLRYTDVFCALADGDPSAYATYKVDAEESEGNPGLYRIKNPAASNPKASGQVDTSQDYWLIIDATDPNAVTIPKQKYGYIARSSDVYVSSWSSGTVDNENHWITFPGWGMVYYYGSDGAANSANNPNETLWKLYLPGAVDYTLNVESENICPSNGAVSLAITVGDDLPVVKYVFGLYNSANAALAAVDTDGIVLENSGDLSFKPEDGDGRYYFAAKGYDADGNAQASANKYFVSNEVANALEWNSIGEATIYEGLVYDFFGGYGPNTYKTEIQECASISGFYRIPNPYFNCTNATLAYYAKNYMTHYGHYLYIHAEDPNAVWIADSPVGLDLGYGEYGVYHYGEKAKSVDGTINFAGGTLAVYMADYGTTLSKTDLIVMLPVEHTVTVKSEDTKYGTVSIVDPATEGPSITTTSGIVTVKAIAAEGAAFLNWTDADGNIVSTSDTYTYVGTSDYELTAHFGLTVTYAFPANGTMSVTVGGNTVTSGTVFAVGTTVDVKVTPADGYMLESLTIAGTSVEPDENGNYSFQLVESTEIVAAFTKQTYQSTITMVASGNGRIDAWTGINDDTDEPAGEQISSGQKVDITSDYSLWFWFIPGEGEKVESASYTLGGETVALVADNDYWISGNNEEYAQKGVCLWPIDGFTEDLAVNVKFSGESQGIEEIGIDPANGPVEYYNLQGLRVAADNLTPGFYIVRQGSKAAKILVAK